MQRPSRTPPGPRFKVGPALGRPPPCCHVAAGRAGARAAVAAPRARLSARPRRREVRHRRVGRVAQVALAGLPGSARRAILAVPRLRAVGPLMSVHLDGAGALHQQTVVHHARRREGPPRRLASTSPRVLCALRVGALRTLVGPLAVVPHLLQLHDGEVLPELDLLGALPHLLRHVDCLRRLVVIGEAGDADGRLRGLLEGHHAIGVHLEIQVLHPLHGQARELLERRRCRVLRGRAVSFTR
mmetsp:Transcript_55133/g.143480  ORF Transcript_55133/g.143480 Transcript_55133/m.143480 type:complete len:242 (-) Transcript_55133:417-1142(-)